MAGQRYEDFGAEANAGFENAFDRVLREGLTLPSFGRLTAERQQLLPVNMYETGEDLVIILPMPGLRTEDIEVTVAENMLSVRGECRGTVEDTKQYVRHEWHYGPYYRAVELPVSVDGGRANASFANGVLVISLPKSDSPRPSRIVLSHLGQNQGEHAGHSAVEFMPGGHTHQKEELTD